MKALKAYSINYMGLSEGQHHFNYKIEKSFLSNFEAALIEDLNVDVSLLFEKQRGFFTLFLQIKGTVRTNCDVCNEEFDLRIKGEEALVVKVVTELPTDKDNEEPEVLYILASESHLNVATAIYELITLSVPMRKAHPVDAKGNATCDPEILKYLNGTSEAVKEIEPSEEENKGSVWEELKKLKNL